MSEADTNVRFSFTVIALLYRLLDLFRRRLVNRPFKKNEISRERYWKMGKGLEKRSQTGEDGLCYAVFDGFSDESLGNATIQSVIILEESGSCHHN